MSITGASEEDFSHLKYIVYRVNPSVTNEVLNALFATAWPDYKASDFTPILSRSLAYICAFADDLLVGFVNLAWDGGIHAFVLDTTVHAHYQRQGIGQKLVEEAIAVAKEQGIEWLHVDYEPHLEGFYRQCGFEPTLAGLRNLKR
jgi:GNAT superfamily N-acetyltransferase